MQYEAKLTTFSGDTGGNQEPGCMAQMTLEQSTTLMNQEEGLSHQQTRCFCNSQHRKPLGGPLRAEKKDLRSLQVETDHGSWPVSRGRGGEVSHELSVLCSDGIRGRGIGAEVRLVLLGAHTYS